jgi:protein involved in polysaccharide export with SLBB domain
MTVTFPRIDDLSAAGKAEFLKVREHIDKALAALSKNPDLFIPM